MRMSLLSLLFLGLLSPLQVYADADLTQYLSADGARLDIRNSEITDGDLEQLAEAKFKNVREVSISSPSVTNAAMKYLVTLPLEKLSLQYTKVDDHGLDQLQSLPLKSLDLYGSTWVSPDGIARLKAARPGIEIR